MNRKLLWSLAVGAAVVGAAALRFGCGSDASYEGSMFWFSRKKLSGS